MRLNEISNEEKSFLTLQGVEYSFVSDLEMVMSAYSIIGKSNHRRNMLINDIDLVLYRMIPVLNYGFLNDDPDIIAIKDIYSKLLEIKNKL